MRLWSRAELRDGERAAPRIIYPLSGPDLLHSLMLFPDAKEYVLLGLEPVGTVPSPAALPSVRLTDALQSLRESMAYALQWGYFVTEEMEARLRGTPLPGVLPILLVSLVRTGHAILRVRSVVLDSEGAVLPSDSAAGAPSAVRVDFKREGGPLFAEFPQPALQNAYATGTRRHLGFSFAYKDADGQASLVVARRTR